MEKWTAFLSHLTIFCIITQSSPAPVRFDDWNSGFFLESLYNCFLSNHELLTHIPTFPLSSKDFWHHPLFPTLNFLCFSFSIYLASSSTFFCPSILHLFVVPVLVYMGLLRASGMEEGVVFSESFWFTYVCGRLRRSEGFSCRFWTTDDLFYCF